MTPCIWLCATIFRWTVYAHWIPHLQKPRGSGTSRQPVETDLLQVEAIGQNHQAGAQLTATPAGNREAQGPAAREEGPAPDHPPLDLQPEELSSVCARAGSPLQVNHLLTCNEMCYPWSILLTLCDGEVWACHRLAGNTVFFSLYFCWVRGGGSRRVVVDAQHLQKHAQSSSAI